MTDYLPPKIMLKAIISWLHYPFFKCYKFAGDWTLQWWNDLLIVEARVAEHEEFSPFFCPREGMGAEAGEMNEMLSKALLTMVEGKQGLRRRQTFQEAFEQQV